MKQFSQIIRATLIMLAVLACSPAPSQGESDCCKSASATSSETLAEKWGIQITSLRMSAGGSIVDFRYKVVDPEKAATLSDRESKPFLVDQASGKKLLVPRTPKVGPLRQTAQKPEAGKVYFALFANPAKLVKAGSKVTVVLGDFRAENLAVE